MNIEKLVLYTANIAETEKFYVAKLGMQLIDKTEDSLNLKAGTTVLQFKHRANSNPFYHFAFNIPHNQVNSALQWCLQKELSMLPFENKNLVDFPNWNAESVYFLDNNGSILEIIARHDLENGSNEPFSAKQLLCVSEIGIVTDDVPSFCTRAIKQFGIPYYEKQRPTPNFSVMGDAEGLFIVVPAKRKWFPTAIPSAKFPLLATIKQNGNVYELDL